VSRMTIAAAALATLALPMAAAAQQGGPLSELLPRFFAPSRPVTLAETGHQAHFGSQPAALATMTLLNRGIATQLSTFPLGSSSGGFSYVFDPSLGVFSRSSESFGPLFAERANTVGKGKVSLGTNFVHSTFDAFEGLSLKNGDATFVLVHEDFNRDGSLGEPYFEGDIIEANLFLNLKADTAVTFFNYGVTEKIDVGLAVPVQRVEMGARLRYHISHLATANDTFLVHTFGATGDYDDRNDSGEAQGLGDVLVRAKYRPWSARGFAAAVDIRLPTGDETQLLGSGATQVKMYAIASGMGARFSPHVNAGYTISWGGSSAIGALPNEINMAAGFDGAIHRRLTVTADLVGRTLRRADRVVVGEKTYEYHTNGSSQIKTAVRPDITSVKGDLNLLLSSFGVKLNPFGRLLLSGNLLLTPSKRGLQDFMTPVVSLDYSF
jgi:hypothetical protein